MDVREVKVRCGTSTVIRMTDLILVVTAEATAGGDDEGGVVHLDPPPSPLPGAAQVSPDPRIISGPSDPPVLAMQPPELLEVRVVRTVDLGLRGAEAILGDPGFGVTAMRCGGLGDVS